jgi:aldose 1-epimerase
VRAGQFAHAGTTHQLPLNFGRHAIHGTVFDTAWSIVDQSPKHAVLVSSLGKRWPFSGHVVHEVTLDESERAIVCTLTVSTTSDSMPAQVGWHPWFLRPATLEIDFAEMYVRDEQYIPSGRRIAPPPGPWDDCFVGARQAPTIVFADDARITMESDCDHWVIYDMPKHALCVEPQSGPPDGFTLAPHVVTPQSPLHRTMKLIAR